MVLAVEGDRVKLGLTAPRYVPIYRAEIYRKLAESLATDAGTEFS